MDPYTALLSTRYMKVWCRATRGRGRDMHAVRGLGQSPHGPTLLDTAPGVTGSLVPLTPARTS